MLDLGLARLALKDDISWIIESWLPWQGDIVATVALEKEWMTRGFGNLKSFRA
jgi:hypothetical protein